MKCPFDEGSLNDLKDARPFLPPRLILKFCEVMHRMDQTELNEDALQNGATQSRDLFSPKEDIEFEIVRAKTKGKTRTTFNLAVATYEALRRTALVKTQRS